MNKIQELAAKFDETSKEESITFASREKILDEKRRDFYEHFVELARKMTKYGNPVYITIPLINGVAKQEDFVLKLAHYEEPDKLLTGCWLGSRNDKVQVVCSLNTDFKESQTDESNRIFYMSCLDFTFVQLYAKRNEIYNLFEAQIIKEITEHIQFNEMLIKITKEITD